MSGRLRASGTFSSGQTCTLELEPPEAELIRIDETALVGWSGDHAVALPAANDAV